MLCSRTMSTNLSARPRAEDVPFCTTALRPADLSTNNTLGPWPWSVAACRLLLAAWLWCRHPGTGCARSSHYCFAFAISFSLVAYSSSSRVSYILETNYFEKEYWGSERTVILKWIITETLDMYVLVCSSVVSTSVSIYTNKYPILDISYRVRFPSDPRPSWGVLLLTASQRMLRFIE